MMFLSKRFSQFKLGRKFTILLSLAFLVGILLSGSALAYILRNNAQSQIRTQAEILFKAMNSVRVYTNNQVSPELAKLPDDEIFLPERIPSYAVREVFELLRQDPTFTDFFYKDAALNPTNPRDKADSFEQDLVTRFRQDEDLQNLQGFRVTPTANLFYLARPFSITDPTCLECHDTPERAPKSMIELYGSENGFNWPLNKILGIQIIYVPGNQVIQLARQSFLWVIGIVALFFATATWLVNLWLNGYVVKPLRKMTRVAEAVSMGETDAEFESKSEDEIGTLATAFTRMKTSLKMAMERLERYRRSQ